MCCIASDLIVQHVEMLGIHSYDDIRQLTIETVAMDYPTEALSDGWAIQP